MITRPLSPLRNATFNVPPPRGDSLLVVHWIRKDPLSLVNVSVWVLPRPDHEARCFQATTRGVVSGRGASGGASHAARRSAIVRIAARSTGVYDRTPQVQTLAYCQRWETPSVLRTAS